jgi:hypothetical protein
MGAGFVRICTDENFERDVLGAERFVLVSFGASWCGPCRLLAPGLRALAAQQKDRLMVAKLDVETSPVTADRYASCSRTGRRSNGSTVICRCARSRRSSPRIWPPHRFPARRLGMLTPGLRRRFFSATGLGAMDLAGHRPYVAP